MASLSTLELMLHELQSQESHVDHGKMPILPQRPVSKARISTSRARRAVLSFHMQELGGKTKEEFVDSRSKRNVFEFVEGGIAFNKNLMKVGGEEDEEKGIIGIQKCFRGYQARSHYHKLKEAIITLQSFIRGEKARKEFQISTERLTRTHINQEFVWKPLRNQETMIIYLQSVVRAWLSRRHQLAIENTKEAEDLHEENKEKLVLLEHVTVSTSYIRNLERQVLRSEAALRHKKRENSNLEIQIQQIHRKWELHDDKMNSKEKLWQDEFTSIQMNLESARETKPNEVTPFPQNPNRRQDDYGETNLTIRQILELQENDSGFHVDNMLNSRKGHKHELRKLKGRFKAWMKEFRARLHEVKRTLDRFDDGRTERAHKTCFIS
ncbi:hypothetical protein L1987_00996 [Smallanthus sonchifolius]|uniref:Uncharacterized protein n=1 Tax=Smallanthus sonchifolius TaxID=185202 RepID=A0ACB9K3N8_9ASTR|nr:hypothetical protein L1987_00996 [Smallanthus sonchifolius]